MQIENIEVYNLKQAIEGMRNPHESWNLSDSFVDDKFKLILGEKDFKLASKLVKSGRDHRKFMRQILISCEITAPAYWWRQFDTYKVGVTVNSTSQMHTLGSRKLTKSDFEVDDWNIDWDIILNNLNERIESYHDNGKRNGWKDILQMIPQSFIYSRKVILNYEVLKNQYDSRIMHRLSEWRLYIKEMIDNIRYPELIMG